MKQTFIFNTISRQKHASKSPLTKKNPDLSQFLGFIFSRNLELNESESVTEAVRSQLKGGLTPSSQLNPRPSDGEDEAALMSLRFYLLSLRDTCSGRDIRDCLSWSV